MTHRDAKLQIFYDFTETAISRRAETCANAVPAAKPVFDALRKRVGPQGNFAPERLPVCHALGSALHMATTGPAPIPDLAAALNELSPRLRWQRRNGASPNGTSFHEGHANTLVAGPGGLIYNEPNVLHAMRTDEQPLPAIWSLRVGSKKQWKDELA